MDNDEEPNDADLLYAWRGGDGDAGHQLCSRHYAALTRFFDNKLSEDADDLVQESFAACVQGRDRIEGGFRAYLFGIAYIRFKRHLRRRYRIPEDEIPSRLLCDSDPGPSTMCRRSEERRRLLMALRQLPIPMQTALELKYWEEMKSPEIARVLGVEPPTVRSYIHRGGLLLKKIVTERDL
ncbi:MAG: sigma-70 family RNA polymerase sigma factor [Deltaproteobacteria bacterium]|nr:sigma-70 family RNA polymerase sigma factor [Deltaproteobacteria bacterium]